MSGICFEVLFAVLLIVDGRDSRITIKPQISYALKMIYFFPKQIFLLASRRYVRSLIVGKPALRFVPTFDRLRVRLKCYYWPISVFQSMAILSLVEIMNRCSSILFHTGPVRFQVLVKPHLDLILKIESSLVMTITSLKGTFLFVCE